MLSVFCYRKSVKWYKVTTIGPNDGNNYTSGYVSQINFIDLFVNPSDERSNHIYRGHKLELGETF